MRMAAALIWALVRAVGGTLVLVMVVAVPAAGVTEGTALATERATVERIDAPPRLHIELATPVDPMSGRARPASGVRTAAPTFQAAAPGTRTALIVGINDSDAPDHLEGAVTDATYVRDALYRYGFRPENVTVLLENQATRPRVLFELRRLAQRTPASGFAVFAWSGHAGRSSLRTAEGARLYASELSSALGRVRSPLWTSLAVCYAGAYALPGIVGPNRIATFSSSSSDYTYELGRRGTWMMLHLVKYAMIDGKAPKSIESAYAFARRSISEQNPARVPILNDGIPGDVSLGPVTWARHEPSNGGSASPPKPTDEPRPTPDDGGGSDGGPAPLGEIVCDPLGC